MMQVPSLENEFDTVMVWENASFLRLERDGAFARIALAMGAGSNARFRFTRLLDIAAGEIPSISCMDKVVVRQSGFCELDELLLAGMEQHVSCTSRFREPFQS